MTPQPNYQDDIETVPSQIAVDDYTITLLDVQPLPKTDEDQAEVEKFFLVLLIKNNTSP